MAKPFRRARPLIRKYTLLSFRVWEKREIEVILFLVVHVSGCGCGSGTTLWHVLRMHHM